MIQGDDYIYTVSDLSLKAVGLPTHGIITRTMNRKHGCRIVVGDSVPYDQQKDKLFVLDAAGKECKLDIVRQEGYQSFGSSAKPINYRSCRATI